MRFLNFSIEKDEYGVPLEHIREVIAFPEISGYPTNDQHFLGIINLRGEIIPIIDLRMVLRRIPTLTHETSVVVCEIGAQSFGVVVDCIHSVVAPEQSQILDYAKGAGGAFAQSDYICQVISKEGKICLVVDIPKLLDASEEEIARLKGVLEKGTVAA